SVAVRMVKHSSDELVGHRAFAAQGPDQELFHVVRTQHTQSKISRAEVRKLTAQSAQKATALGAQLAVHQDEQDRQVNDASQSVAKEPRAVQIPPLCVVHH